MRAKQRNTTSLKFYGTRDKLKIFFDNIFMGTLILDSPLQPLEQTIIILQKQLTFISIVSLVVGTILAFALSRHFTKPILEITQAAQRIAQGKFDTSIIINSNDEIGTLGNIINDLPVELQKTEKFRKDFIANTSHELKTPISVIQAYAELIRDIEGDNMETRNKHLEVIIDEACRLNHIVEDILYLSQMETGNIKLDYEYFLVNELIDDVIAKTEYLAARNNIKIQVNIENPQLKIYADRQKIYQVLYNVLSNAITYSTYKGQVFINLYANFRLEVIDTGIGIAAADLPYIWDRFYKVDKARPRDYSSTGLGLSIVKIILEAHQFKYGIESKINEGTLFWMELYRRDKELIL